MAPQRPGNDPETPTTRYRRRRSLAGIAAMTLALAACTVSGVVDNDDLVSLVDEELADELGIAITDVECPRVTDPEVGDTVTCTGIIDEQTSEFTITFTDVDDLTASVANADAILQRDALVSLIADEFAAAGGTAVEVNCVDADAPGTLYLVVAPGSVVDCDVVLDDGEELVVLVDVIDRTGAVEFSIAG